MLEFFGRRWLELRIGYGTYIMFMIGFVNFISIQHGLIESINTLMPLWMFSIIVLAVLIPSSVIIGRFHQRKQAGTESVYQTHVSPYTYKIVPNSKEYEIIKSLSLILGSMANKESLEQKQRLDDILNGIDSRQIDTNNKLKQ